MPNDSATVTVPSGNGDLAGSVRFRLFVDDTTCAGTPAYDSGPIPITGPGLSRTVSSSNTTAYKVSRTFSWLVTNTTTNTGHRNVTSICDDEHSVLTIDNDFKP